MSISDSGLAQVAVYHPWPLLTPQPISAWAKNMMLFFDQVALIAPPAAAESLRPEDEATVMPLVEMGLFRFLDPATLVDQTVADQILSFLLEAATAPNAHLSPEKKRGRSRSQETERDRQLRKPVHGMLDLHSILRFQHSKSLFGEGGWGVVYEGRDLRGGTIHLNQPVIDAAEMIWQELFHQGLAIEKSALHPLLLHPSIWVTLEALIVYALRPVGQSLNMEIHPCTNEPSLIAGTMRLACESLPPSQADIIESDLNQIGVDLSRVPLDEVLAFRGQYGRQYRDYAIALRMFMAELAPMTQPERREAFLLRKGEIEDAAEELRKLSRRSWRQPTASLALGIVGAAWSAYHGDIVPAILALIGGGVGANVQGSNVRGVYSYFFEAQRRLTN
jgi:hypothetical protein